MNEKEKMLNGLWHSPSVIYWVLWLLQMVWLFRAVHFEILLRKSTEKLGKIFFQNSCDMKNFNWFKTDTKVGIDVPIFLIAIKDITSIQKKYCKEKTRKGRTYTYSLYYVETKSQNFYINKKAYNYLLKYSKKNIKDFNYTEYEFYGLIFIFILFFIGIINIYFHFKPFNLNIIDDKMIKTIERDGIIGLLQK